MKTDTVFTWNDKELPTASSVIYELLTIKTVDEMSCFLGAYYRSTILSKEDVIKNVFFGISYFAYGHVNEKFATQLFKESLVYFILYG